VVDCHIATKNLPNATYTRPVQEQERNHF